MKELMKATLIELKGGETYREVGERLGMSRQAIQHRLIGLEDEINDKAILKKIKKLKNKYYYTADDLGIQDYEMVGFQIINKDYGLEGGFLHCKKEKKPLFIRVDSTDKDLSKTRYEKYGHIYMLPKVSLPKLARAYAEIHGYLDLTKKGWEKFQEYFDIKSHSYQYESFLSVQMTKDFYYLKNKTIGLRKKYAPKVILLESINNRLEELKSEGKEIIHVEELRDIDLRLGKLEKKPVKVDKEYYIYSLVKNELEWNTTEPKDLTIVLGDYEDLENLHTKPDYIADYVNRHEGVSFEVIKEKFPIKDFEYTTTLRDYLITRDIILFCGDFHTWDYLKDQKEYYNIFKDIQKTVKEDLSKDLDIFYDELAANYDGMVGDDIREIIHFIYSSGELDIETELSFSIKYCTALRNK